MSLDDLSGVDDTSPRCRVRVAPGGDDRGLFATEPIVAGEVILAIDGPLSDRPSRWSIQVSERSHVEALHDPAAREHQVWRFLNHCCAPNTVVRGSDLVAIDDIATGEEVSFDYRTTEYELAEPFTCGCGSCDGRPIRGFKHLSETERIELAPRLASHLRRLMGDPAVGRATRGA